MKLTLILLISFCAFVAPHAQIIPSETDIELRPEFRGPIIDGVKEILENAVKFITESVDQIKTKLNEIIEKIKESTGGVVGDALNKVWAIIKKIADIAKMGIVAQVCAKPYENRIAELMEEVQAGTGACTAESELQLQNAGEKILEVVKVIEGYGMELYDMVKACFDNDGDVLGGTWCVAKQVFVIRDKVNAAIDLAEVTITETKETAEEIINNHQVCVATATEGPMKELHNIMGEVQKCVAENQ